MTGVPIVFTQNIQKMLLIILNIDTDTLNYIHYIYKITDKYNKNLEIIAKHIIKYKNRNNIRWNI